MNAVKVLFISKILNEMLMKLITEEAEVLEKRKILELPELKRIQGMLIVN